jgi:hypothetical protein
MSNRFTVLLAAAAGFSGGFLSRYASPPAYAQAPRVQQEVRAQKFVLVDEGDVPRGAFGIETDGTAQIEVTDKKGQLWLYRPLEAKSTWFGRPMEDRPKVLSLIR